MSEETARMRAGFIAPTRANAGAADLLSRFANAHCCVCVPHALLVSRRVAAVSNISVPSGLMGDESSSRVVQVARAGRR